MQARSGALCMSRRGYAGHARGLQDMRWRSGRIFTNASALSRRKPLGEGRTQHAYVMNIAAQEGIPGDKQLNGSIHICPFDKQ